MGLPGLFKIDISENAVTKMPSLSDLPSLREIDLKDNQLQGNLAIEEIPTLTRLDVSRNKLTDVKLSSLVLSILVHL